MTGVQTCALPICPGGELVENGAAGLLRGVAQHDEGAGGGPVGGDLGAGQPGAVDVAEQVVLDADRLVDGGGLQDSGETAGAGEGTEVMASNLAARAPRAQAPPMRRIMFA